MSDTAIAEIDRIADVLTSGVYRYSRETQLHLGIEQALTGAGFNPQPEQRIKGGRIDFLVGRVGIEVKIKGTAPDLLAQLVRYAASPEVDGLLVASTRIRHRDMPTELNGKPVRVVIIGSPL